MTHEENADKIYYDYHMAQLLDIDIRRMCMLKIEGQ